MVKEIVLEVEPRQAVGRSEVRKLRAEGFLPGVIYGKDIEVQSLAVPRYELIRILHSHGMHALVSLKVNGGGTYLALVKEVQIDAVRQEALHIDFHRVREDEEVHTEVPVELDGTPEGVTMGGVLEIQAHSVAISALPRGIPEAIHYDVSRMEMGDVVRIGDLVAPEGVTILVDPEQPVCSVVAPRVEVEAPVLSEEELAALADLSPEDLEALQALQAAEEAPEGEGGGGAEQGGGETPAE